MDYKDYYKILGVPENADAKAIKKAFRNLARKYHPDANPDDRESAEQRFKEINEAYEVLGDANKRTKYDQIRQNYQRWQHSGGQPGGFDWSQWMAGQPGGARVEYSGSADELFSDFFQAIFGGAGGQAGDLYLNVAVADNDQFRREGDDLYTDVTLDLYTAVLGGEVQIPTMTGKVTLKIAPGTQPGQLIRVRGKGMPNVHDPKQTGDLYVRANVELPGDLSAKERALFKELASIRGQG
jgi:curved DNA-binding protein